MLTENEIKRLAEHCKEELRENFDLFDFKSEIDLSLTYQENKGLLNQKMSNFIDKQLSAQMESYKEAEATHIRTNQGSLNLAEVLKKHQVIGIAGNRGTGKSMLTLTHLKAIRANYPKLAIACMGVEESLKNTLKSLNITVLESTMDILDLNLTNTLIYIDEFAVLFSTKKQDKEQDKLMRFFDRLEHQNCKLIISTAREGFYNKFMCSRITAFLVKQIEYDALVNGSWLKERVKAINSNSDYRLELDKDKYYLVSPDELTSKYSFAYDSTLDSKKENKSLFGD
jgi:hypothetical protein